MIANKIGDGVGNCSIRVGNNSIYIYDGNSIRDGDNVVAREYMKDCIFAACFFAAGASINITRNACCAAIVTIPIISYYSSQYF